MVPIRIIRRRIKSVQSTAKVTRAMEMIAASKMKQAQQRTLAGRPYAEKMSEVLADVSGKQQPGEELHPLLQQREINRIAIVHITPDRGLCGGLNSNIKKMTTSFMGEQNVPVSVIAVGKKGRTFISRYTKGLLAEFTDMGDKPSLVDTLPISRIIIDDYTNGSIDKVYLAYTKFISTVNQVPVLEELLPAKQPEGAADVKNVEYIYEPSPVGVLNELLPRYVEMQIYHALLESIASEQSARMVAMRNASDAANDMIEELTLLLNKVRQEMITNELLDIAGGIVQE